jgi:methyltransferase-like protein
MSNQYTKQQFHKYSPEEQKIMADTYLENQKILDKSGIAYSGKNSPVFKVSTRNTYSVLAPYTGAWIMEMLDGSKISGKGFTSFLTEFRKRQ